MTTLLERIDILLSHDASATFNADQLREIKEELLRLSRLYDRLPYAPNRASLEALESYLARLPEHPLPEVAPELTKAQLSTAVMALWELHNYAGTPH